MSNDLPSYRDLPVRDGAPPGSSWGVWGDDDQLGCLNLLNDERTLAAVRLVRRGAVFPLGLPLDEPKPHMVWRTNPVHHILHVGHETRGFQPGGEDDPSGGLMDRDDYIDGLWLQGSSQWDGFTHIRHPEFGNYNGVPDRDIHGGPGTKLGVDQWAQRGIVGRGVLLDVKRYLEKIGTPYDAASAYQISPEELSATADDQGVSIETGDILLIHTGHLQRYLDSDLEERARMWAPESQTAPGLEVTERTIEYLWDHHVAAVAADTVGVEAASPTLGFALHPRFLTLIGMPLGEYWTLDALARDCADDGRYEFLLVSVPLNISGGVGTPPQAVALK